MKRGASLKEHYRALAALLKADGCTLAPDLWFKECCNRHDVHYRTHRTGNGYRITRRKADADFRKCLRRSAISPLGRWIAAPVYWLAVRTFGDRAWNAMEETVAG